MPRHHHDARPVNPETDEPLPVRAHPGYYPGFRTLSQKAFWDEATRKVVLARVETIPPFRFFFCRRCAVDLGDLQSNSATRRSR